MENTDFDYETAAELVKTQREGLKAAREKFIAERTKHEYMVNEWAKQIKLMDSKMLEGLNFPEEISLRTLNPEAYAENPNKEVYNQEFRNMMMLVVELNKRIVKLCEETSKCLQECKGINSGK